MKRLPILLGSLILLLSLSISSVSAIQPNHPSTTNTTSDSVQATKWYPGHYFKVGRTHDLYNFLEEKGHHKDVLNSPNVTGVLVSVPWRLVEPQKGQYNFSIIEQSLQKADAHGKKVLLRVMERSFHNNCKGVDDPLPGWVPRAKLGNNGCVARFWENHVADAYIAMLKATAQRYDNDPRLAAVFELESAFDVKGLSRQQKQQGFTNYKRILRAMANDYQYTIVAPYLNWPRDFVDEVVRLIETDLANTAVGLGSPDVVPAKDNIQIVDHMRRLSNTLPIFGGMDGTFMGSDSPQRLCQYQQGIGSHIVIWGSWRKHDGSAIVSKTLNLLNNQGCPLNSKRPSKLPGTGTPPPTAIPPTTTPVPPTTTPMPSGPQVTQFNGVPADQIVRGVANIDVTVTGSDIDKVVFTLTGPQNTTWTEQNPPYYFMGNKGDQPFGWDTRRIPNGSYTLTATAFDDQGRTGAQTLSLTVDN